MSTSTQQNAHLNSVHVCKARRGRQRHREELVDKVDVGVGVRSLRPSFMSTDKITWRCRGLLSTQ